jgi:hypothetical protein
MPYELYYWPGIQGRGEFVRLALEAAGAAYDSERRGRSATPKYHSYIVIYDEARPPAKGAWADRGFRFVDHAFRFSFTNESGIFRRYPDLDSGRGSRSGNRKRRAQRSG